MMISIGWIVMHIMLLKVMSQTPGDADSFCIKESGSTHLPPYPPNSRILMDSYQYISLLPALAGRESTWQQVDVDNRTDDSGGRTDVSDSVECRYSYRIHNVLKLINAEYYSVRVKYKVIIFWLQHSQYNL